MRIRVLVFARLREILGESDAKLELPEGARIEDAWTALAAGHPALRAERSSTRAARNGRLADFETALTDGDELALLPPVGGG
ncbi:MAG TPA: MoaD/ThiS family protein [Candidatus Nitrosotalea sp.]|nr:MoaD/ThiS family protein [Candidatus Nitrosotalea sp.]